MTEEQFRIPDTQCIWCWKVFDTVQEHDEHYLACAQENHISPSEEEGWELTHNPNNY